MEQQTIKDIETIRILLLGDAGVGKSRLTDLLASSVDTPTPFSRSVGDTFWNVQVRLHEYPKIGTGMPPTPDWTSSSSSPGSSISDRLGTFRVFSRGTPPKCEMIPYFVEFYDLKSSVRLPPAHRDRLYRNIDGIILVYDLLEMHTQDNLHDWLYRPLRQICQSRHKRAKPILKRRHVPILVVGTKMDLLKTRRLRRSGGISHQLGTEEILINALDPNSFAEKSRNEGKLRKFLNNAVEFKRYFPTRR